jgi:hypothetical protein
MTPARLVDTSCMAAGALNLVFQKIRRSTPLSEWRQSIPDLFNGAALPPFLMLILGAAWWTWMLSLVVEISRVTLFLAGLVALFALLGMLDS